MIALAFRAPAAWRAIGSAPVLSPPRAIRAVPNGRVYLVGAAPGAIDLLTLRAARPIGEADVIMHGRLVSAEILGLARRGSERIDVGKRRTDHRLLQNGINALLVRLRSPGRRWCG